MALVNINNLQKCGSASKFASSRLPYSLFRCTQFTTTPSNVAWVNHEHDQKKNQRSSNSLSVQRKCLSLQSQEAGLSSELLSLNEPMNRVLFLPKCTTRTELLKLEKNKISFLKEWARNPLIDHREVIALSLKDYERCLKNLLESEMQCKNQYRANKFRNQQKWQVKNKIIGKVQRDWTSSRFGHAVVKNEAQYINPSRELNCTKWNVSQVNSKKNVVKLSNFDKDLKAEKGKEVRDKPNPTELANVLLMLREELPLFFVKSHCYDLYDANIMFVNNMVGLTTRGLTAYKTWLSAVKITNKLLMSDLSLDVLKITKDSQDSTVKVRWRIRGIPRYQIILPIFSEKYSYIDGFSIFEVGKDGLIHCHRLERVMPSSSRQRQRPAWGIGIFGLFGLLGRCRPAEVYEILDTE